MGVIVGNVYHLKRVKVDLDLNVLHLGNGLQSYSSFLPTRHSKHFKVLHVCRCLLNTFLQVFDYKTGAQVRICFNFYVIPL